MTTATHAQGTHKLKVRPAPSARDPNLMKSGGTAPNPPAAPLTEDPNRYTIRVPSFATKLSLGQGDLVETATRNKRIGVGTESGIVGQTDLHVHFHTFGTGNDQAKTLVRLGIPPTSIPATAAYAPDAETGIGELNPAAYASWPGYSMVTQGASYQESRYNHLVVSAEGEVRVVAKTLVSLSTPGDILLGADPTATPEMLVQNQGDPNDVSGYGAPDQLERITQIASLGLRGAKLAENLVSLLTAAVYGSPVDPMPLMAMWEPPDWETSLKVAANWATFAAGLGAFAASLAMPTSPGGKVGAYAEKSITLGALETVAIATPGIASINADTLAIINAGLSASLTGLVSASVSGVLTSVSGLYSAVLESVFHPVAVRSPAGVNVFSAAGPICVTGNTSVQMNSVLGGAYVHGLANSYIGAGPEGAGMGVVNFPEVMSIGNLLSAETFATPAPDPTRGITILPELISLTMLPATVDITPAALEIEAPSVDVTAEDGAMITAPVIVLSGMVYLG
jgi:hypothetical protein